MPKKIWKTNRADREFSLWIRGRDKKCVFCGKESPPLDNSHYWGRYVSVTRYNPENCDTLCRGCHFKHENSKPGFYRDFKIKQLGEKGYQALRKEYYQSKMTRREAIIELMKLLGEYED